MKQLPCEQICDETMAEEAEATGIDNNSEKDLATNVENLSLTNQKVEKQESKKSMYPGPPVIPPEGGDTDKHCPGFPLF